MKIYGIDVAEGAHITNASIAVGSTFPTTPDVGELFYYDTGTPATDGWYLYRGTAWTAISAPAYNNSLTYNHIQNT